MSLRAFNIATFNTQGLRTENLKKVSIARDAEKYNIQVIGLTETQQRKYNRTSKRKEEELQSITMEQKEQTNTQE